MVKTLPDPYINVKVTFDKEIHYGENNEKSKTIRVKKRAFYATSTGMFIVPGTWKEYNGSFLPSGEERDKVAPKDIIHWEYDRIV